VCVCRCVCVCRYVCVCVHVCVSERASAGQMVDVNACVLSLRLFLNLLTYQAT